MVRDAGLLARRVRVRGRQLSGHERLVQQHAGAGDELPGDGDVHAAGPGQLRRHAGRRLRRRHRHDRDRDARPHRRADEPRAAEGARLVRDRQRRRRLLRPRHDRRPRRPHLHDHQRRRAAGDADGGRRRPRQRVQLEGRQLPGDRRHVPGDARRPARTARWSSASRRRAAGTRTSQLLIFYYDGANTQYAKRALSATATDRALLQITDWSNPPSPNGPGQSPYDYGTAGQSQRAHVHGDELGRRPRHPDRRRRHVDAGRRLRLDRQRDVRRRHLRRDAGVGRQLHRQRDVHAGGRRGAHQHAFALVQRRRHDAGRGARRHRHGDDEGALERLRLQRSERPRRPERQRTAVRLRRLGRRRRPRVHRAQRRRRPGDDGRQRRRAGNGIRLEGRHVPGHRRRLRRHAGDRRDLQAGGHVHAQRPGDAVRSGAGRVQRRRRHAHRDPRDDGHTDGARARDGRRVLRPEQLQQLHAVRLRRRRARQFTRARVHRLQHRRPARVADAGRRPERAVRVQGARRLSRQRRHLRIDARRRHLVPAGRRVRAADRRDREQHDRPRLRRHLRVAARARRARSPAAGFRLGYDEGEVSHASCAPGSAGARRPVDRL